MRRKVGDLESYLGDSHGKMKDYLIRKRLDTKALRQEIIADRHMATLFFGSRYLDEHLGYSFTAQNHTRLPC